MGKSIVEESKEAVKKKQADKKAALKPKQQKKEVDMKNIKNSSTLRTILTVIITLLAVAAFAFTYMKGMEAGAAQQKSVNNQVSAQVKDVVSSIKVESKDNQQ